MTDISIGHVVALLIIVGWLVLDDYGKNTVSPLSKSDTFVFREEKNGFIYRFDLSLEVGWFACLVC